MATLTITVPDRLAALPADLRNAILAEVAELLEHHDDTDPAKYEAAVYALLGSIRAAAPEEP